MNKLVEMQFGSHLYGTETESSDLDLKGVYIPTGREIVLHSYAQTISTSRKKKECERNTSNDIDTEIFSLDRFLKLLTDGQTVALDMLFAPTKMWVTCSEDFGLFQDIQVNREKLLTRNVNAFVGYARMQAAKYGIKGSRMDALKQIMAFLEPLPLYDRLFMYKDGLVKLVTDCANLVSLEKTPLMEIIQLPGPDKVTPLDHLHICGRKISINCTVKFAKECFGRILNEYGLRAKKAHLDGGVDWKALSHAVRVNNEAIELLTTHNITFPRPDRELLLKIKTGQMQYEAVANMIEQGLADLFDAHAKSTLRDKPDLEWVDNFVADVYTEQVRKLI